MRLLLILGWSLTRLECFLGAHRPERQIAPLPDGETLGLSACAACGRLLAVARRAPGAGWRERVL